LLKPPSLRNNNGSLQLRVRIDGRDTFINRQLKTDVPVCKSLERDGYSSDYHSWAPSKKVKERLVPLTAQVDTYAKLTGRLQVPSWQKA
jgi:hypothetical protein